MPEYKSYQLVGGKPVIIDPLTVSEAGTVFAPEGHAFNPVICEGGEGNLNVVVTVTGTLADPWGDEFANFKEAAADDVFTVSAELAIDASALGMGTAYLQWDRRSTAGAQFSSATLKATLAEGKAAMVTYSIEDGTTILNALILVGGNITDLSTYAAQLPTTMTIIYHPLPEE